MDVVPLLPYYERRQQSEGSCKRCGRVGVRVIESVESGFLCWDLGYCVALRPLPEARPWDRSMAEII
jgi:hypothetical protein